MGERVEGVDMDSQWVKPAYALEDDESLLFLKVVAANRHGVHMCVGRCHEHMSKLCVEVVLARACRLGSFDFEPKLRSPNSARSKPTPF